MAPIAEGAVMLGLVLLTGSGFTFFDFEGSEPWGGAAVDGTCILGTTTATVGNCLGLDLEGLGILSLSGCPVFRMKGLGMRFHNTALGSRLSGCEGDTGIVSEFS